MRAVGSARAGSDSKFIHPDVRKRLYPISASRTASHGMNDDYRAAFQPQRGVLRTLVGMYDPVGRDGKARHHALLTLKGQDDVGNQKPQDSPHSPYARRTRAAASLAHCPHSGVQDWPSTEDQTIPPLAVAKIG